MTTPNNQVKVEFRLTEYAQGNFAVTRNPDVYYFNPDELPEGTN